MKNAWTANLAAAVLIVVGGVLLYSWVHHDPAVDLALRVPGADGSPAETAGEADSGPIEGTLTTSDGAGSDLGGYWPRFRGANFDNIAKVDVELSRSWAEAGPAVLWSIDVGEGYAGAAVMNGKVFMIDYDQESRADAIRCLSLADGKEIWRYSYPVKVKRNHGMSRTVPTVTEKFVVAMGPKCHVSCLEANTGEHYWMLDLVREFGAKVPPWYAGQCPLVEDGKVILAPGADALLMAVDCTTGEIIWESANPNGWKMTHSSIMPMEFGGERMYVYCGSGGVAGVSAKDGAILWETNEWKIQIANIPSPLVIGDGLIFLSGGYNSGSMMLRLLKEGDTIVVETAFKLGPEVFGSPQQTPIFYEGYIYGVRPDGQLCCLDTSGNVVWASSSAKKFGLGPYMIVNGLIYVMDDSGLLTLAEATPRSYVQLSQAKLLDGPDSWGPMTAAEGRLILRDLKRMICVDISAQ